MNDSKSTEQRARRAAIACGLMARKSRRHVGSIDNYGGFSLVDPSCNAIVAGSRFDMTAEDVIAWCKGSDDQSAS